MSQGPQDCMRVLEDIEACLERPSATGVWVSRLNQCIDQFSTTLRVQFEGEEQGWYRELPGRFPHSTSRGDELRGEHAQILEKLDEIVRGVQSLEALGEVNYSDIRAQALRLVDSFRRHETKETELLQAAYWREVGTGD